MQLNRVAITNPFNFGDMMEYVGYDLFANFWSPTEYDGNVAYYPALGYNDARVFRNNYSKNIGFSVRCLRD